MSDKAQPFATAIEHYQMTEAEMRTLRSQLFSLRKQYVLRIWEPQLTMLLPPLESLERRIAELEHKLTHVVIID